MGKAKEKEKGNSSSVRHSLKRFRFAIFLAIMAAIISAGTVLFILKAREKTLLERVPTPGNLSFSNKTLEERMLKSHDSVKKALLRNGTDRRLGRKAGELGNLYQTNHFYDEALLCYGVAMDFDPDNPRWPYFLAFVKQEKGENTSVQDLLRKTITLAPRYAPAILKLADSHFKSRETRKAQAGYERRLDVVQGDPYALLGLARIAIDASGWERARAYLSQAVEKTPSFGPAHRLLATVHEHFGRLDDMKRSLYEASQCTRFRPAPDPWIDSLNDLCFDEEQLLVLGSKALTALDIEKASLFFGRARDLNPQNPQTQLALGRLCFMTNQLRESRAFFQKAIDLDPKSDEAYFQLGVISKREGNLKGARKLFLKALDFHPDNANVYNNLGATLLELGDFSGAQEALEKALGIYPEHINARYNLGLALWSLGKTEGAVMEYRNILNVKPNWAAAANSLAWVLATDQNPENRGGIEALKWAQVACRGNGTGNPEYLDTLAAAYAEAGSFETAVKTAREGLNLARKASDAELAKELERRISLYEAGKAFTEDR